MLHDMNRPTRSSFKYPYFWVIDERRDWDFIIWTCEHPVTQMKIIGVYMDLSFYVDHKIFIPIGLGHTK